MLLTAFNESNALISDVSSEARDWYQLGLALYGVGNFKSSIEAFKTSLNLIEQEFSIFAFPQEIYIALGDAFFSSAQWNEARKSYEAALEIDQYDLDLDNPAGYRLERLLREIDSENPNPRPIDAPDTVSWSILGSSFANAYWREDSIEVFGEFASSTTGVSARAWVDMATIYFEEKKLTGLAISAMQNAIQGGNNDDFNCGYLGKLYYSIQDYAAALDAFRAGILLNPALPLPILVNGFAFSAFAANDFAAMKEALIFLRATSSPDKVILEGIEFTLAQGQT